MSKTQSCDDPVIAEIHAIRQHFAEQYHNDLVAYSQAAETHSRALGFQMVESPRPVSYTHLDVYKRQALS